MAPLPNPVRTALTEAKKQGKQVEIPALHRPNMTTVANPDGKTVGTYIYHDPVRFKKEDGTWQTIDTTLLQEKGVVRPKAINDAVTLSAGGNTQLLSIKSTNGVMQLSSTEMLPAPTLSGSTANYANVYGEGIDLQIQITPTGIRQNVVIQKRPGKPLTIRMPIQGEQGLKYRTKSGKVEVIREGKKVADVSPGIMLDAKAANSITDGGIVTASVEADGSNLIYTPDAKFLADEQTEYPVILASDPTPWYGPGFPADAFIATDDRFWGATVTQDMKLMVAGRSKGGYLYRSYIKFDLSNAPFYGRKIINADTRPWNFITSGCGTNGGDMVVRRVTSDWSMSTLRWTNQPSVTTSGQGIKNSGYGRILGDTSEQDIYCPDGEGEIYYSIEGIVQAWADGQPNYGLQISALNEGSGFTWRQYLTSEEDYDLGRPPVLFVLYEPPTETKVQGFFVPGPSDGTPPTDEMVAAHLTDRAEHPSLPGLDTEQARGLREDAEQAFIQDAGFGFYPPEDVSREDWLAELDLSEETSEPETDTTPPNVVATDPAANANEVPVSAVVQATFDEPIITPTFLLKKSDGSIIEGDLTFKGASLSFVPAQALTPTTTYTAEIKGAVDVDGNVMTASYSWAFTTAAGLPPVTGLVAAYGMNEGTGSSVADASGKGNSGTTRDTAW
ncbi:DNRLRE domain-containing protein, partial [Nonomuraea pusilla]